MDVTALAQSLKELILDNDRVSLPGLGSFLADIAPAYFSQDGKTINPPFRRVFFRSSEIWNDGLLEKYYADKRNIPLNESELEIKECLDKLKLNLNIKKSLELPGFGTMRSTKEGNYFFVPEKGLDIYSNAFGLEPISIKVLGLERGEEKREGLVEELIRKEESVKKIEEREIAFSDVMEEDGENGEEYSEFDLPTSDGSATLSLDPMKQNPEPFMEEPVEDMGEGGLVIDEEDPIVMKKQKNIILILSIVAVILLIFVLILVFREQVAEVLKDVLYSPEELNIIELNKF